MSRHGQAKGAQEEGKRHDTEWIEKPTHHTYKLWLLLLTMIRGIQMILNLTQYVCLVVCVRCTLDICRCLWSVILTTDRLYPQMNDKMLNWLNQMITGVRTVYDGNKMIHLQFIVECRSFLLCFSFCSASLSLTRSKQR